MKVIPLIDDKVEYFTEIISRHIDERRRKELKKGRHVEFVKAQLQAKSFVER